MERKWGLRSLGPRQDGAIPFRKVFASSERALDTLPNFESYLGPSLALDAVKSMMFEAGSGRSGVHRNSRGLPTRKSGAHVFLKALGIGLNYL